MDQDRHIRFLIPPFFMFASLLLGAYWDCHNHLLNFLQQDTLKNLIAFFAATSISLIPTGFTISVSSILLVRMWFHVTGKGHYEASIEDQCLVDIRSILEVQHARKADINESLYAVATFDHELLSDNIHQWVRRRWNTFNVCIHSTTAIGMSLSVGLLIFKSIEVKWLLGNIIIMALLLCHGYIAWRDTMGMLEFQCHRKMGSLKSKTKS